MTNDKATIELILKVLGQDGLDGLSKSTEDLKRKLEDLSAQYKRGDIDSEAWVKQHGQLTAELKREQDMLEQLTGKTEAAAGKTANLGQTMLQSGRFVQDFAQGGIGGVLNNVEGLIQALGGGPGLAGALTVAGVGFALLKKPLMELIESFGEGDGKAKAQAAAIEKLREAGEKLKAQLAELNAASDARVGRIQAETDAVERQVKVEEARQAGQRRAFDEDTRRQAEAAKMTGAPSLDEQRRAPSEKARAEDIRKIVGGDPEAQTIAKVVRQAIEFELGRTGAGPSGSHMQEDIQREAKKQTDALLGKFYAGDAGALKDVTGMLHPMLGGEGTLREQLGQLTPQAEMARRGHKIGETLEGFGRKVRDKAAEEVKERQAEAKKAAEKAAGEAGARRGKLAREQTDARLKANAQRVKGNREVKELEREFADDADAMLSARPSEAAAKKAEHARVEAQAGQLVAHGVQIIGDADGPAAAAMASQANPAEVQAIKARTIQNLEQGQAPYAALLDAFREVAEASARNARDTERFAQQLNGLRGRANTTSASPGSFVAPGG